MTAVKEDQCCIVTKNGRKQDEVKNTIRANYVKRESSIINWGGSYDNILSTVSNLLSATKTTDKSTDSVLQDVIPLSYGTLKGDFFRLGVKISNFLYQKNQEAVLGITMRWGKHITKEGEEVIA